MYENTTLQDPVAAVALLGEPNRRRLYELVMSSHEAVGRDDAASTLGMSRELAAFHLDRLVEGGLLEHEYRRRSQRRGPGAGRPAKLYRRAARELSLSLPARDYERAAHVFAEALGRLEGSTGLAMVADVARSRGSEIGAMARKRAAIRPSRRRLTAALLEVLDDAGYEPVRDAASRSIQLTNCPYRSLTDSHRAVTCGMNTAWAEGLATALGGSAFTVEFQPTPDQCCVVLREAPRGGGGKQGTTDAADKRPEKT